MGRAIHELATHSLAAIATVLAVLCIIQLIRHRTFGSVVGLAASLALAGGALAASPFVGLVLFLAAIGLAFLQLLILLLTTLWERWTATALLALACFGLAGWIEAPASEGLRDGIKALGSLEPAQPWWLLAAVVLPAVWWVSRRSLSGLGPVRRYLAVGLRMLVLLLLILALAETRLRRADENSTVLFLVDRSLSIPQEIDSSLPEADAAARGDRRWRRIKQFVNDAVERRGPGRERDQSGVIVFGRRPRLVLPPAEVPRLNFSDELIGNVDENYTDIAAAVKLALASFPEGTAKRIVLLSDGNENLGNALEQARIAKQNGVQIDTIPLAAGFRNENEVLVQSVEAPPQTEQGARLPIRVLVRSYNPRIVTGNLKLTQISEGESQGVAIEAGPGVVGRGPPAVVQLRPGLNSFSFKQTLAGQLRSYTYQAIFQPTGVQAENGESAKLIGDRVQNNSATTHVVALGRRRVLFIEAKGKADEHRLLVDKLQGAGDTKFQIASIESKDLPTNKADLGVLLSSYDCVVLANVPAEDLNEDQQEMIRSNTYDQGCGLVMIGGPDSYGAGGYQNTAIEKALPVDCDIKSVKVAGKGGLVLIMHACEIADGNAIQKQLAKLAIRKLSAADMVGVQYYDFNHKWHVPFQTIGGNRGTIERQMDRMQPGDMPDFDPAINMAMKELNNPTHNLATKHIILISDGDPTLTNTNLPAQLRSSNISCTTIGVATHGAPEVSKMSSIANGSGGKFYNNPNPKSLPAIYIKETRVVSQSFIYDQRFLPSLRSPSGPADKLGTPLPPLYGFVRTTLKQSPLVEMAIEGPRTMDQEFPVLAYWQYGLGKSVAWTSDARSQPGKAGWDQDWANADLYTKYWEQVIGWAIRGVETGKLTMSTEYRDGMVRVLVDARDDKNRPLSDLRLQAKATAPTNANGENTSIDLKFEQKNSGQYEAVFKAEEAGSYFINAQARRPTTVLRNGVEVQVEEADSIRSGVTVPYSPEFADLESNTGLMNKLAELTGGEIYEETDAALARLARSGRVFRSAPLTAQGRHPVWHWLVLLAGITLLFDVAIRRIAIEPAEARATLGKLWDRLRGRGQAVASPVFLERLQNRKTQVGEVLERTTAARRFEADTTRPVSTEAPPLVDANLPPPRPRPAAPSPTTKPAEAESAFERLKRAKKKALEDRDIDKPADDA